ncbi:flagellin [Tateyamaria pelophila]|uniref:flagellin n=1 Tax=Tateyamaria pelophila TaxID=328415 RepID=UPI001CC1A32D|nr:flagellin [Tateyamaria pelophila]
MSSILTNNSAMVALQTLKSINKNLATTQGEISTGKSVATAKDNSAVWAISKVMESDVKGFKAISEGLSLGESTVAVARNASETVTDLLTDIKGKIVAAQESNVDRDKLQTDIVALRDQIVSVVGAAQFNGLNLIDGSSTDAVEVLSSLDRAPDGTVSEKSISVDRQDLSLTTTASTATFGPTDVDDGSLATNGATNDDTAVTVASAGNTAITIESVSEGASYRIVLEDVQLESSGGTAVGSRTFEYVAGTDDSAESVSQNLFSQVSAYLDASTASGDYSLARSGNALTLTNASGENLDVTVKTSSGGTPGTAANGAGLGALGAIDVSSEVGAGQALTAIEGLISTSIDAAAAFGSAEGRLETQSEFISKLTDSLKSGIGSLVDADMEEVSARLQALQTQQQLGVQSLSIANQAPQTILSLFR